MEVLGSLLSIAVVFVAPYVLARILWRIRMSWGVKLTVVFFVPAALVWWLATSGDLADITNPGAAVILGVMIFGWLFGVSSVYRRRLIARTSGDPRT
jgi:hypothetical protein